MKQATHTEPQERFSLRFPTGMREAIAERAQVNRRTMNNEIIVLLEKGMEKRFADGTEV